ncbi:MAG: PstS family phosphate ABC transporter substrate-binding protein [Acidobacteriota bacterium]|nr:PstS family phosphate ABC transporter substrate-binding protein [Acidobacteriota bacterium]
MRPSLVTIIVFSLVLAACGGVADNTAQDRLTGTVSIDGSSTVFPITEAVAEEFQKKHPRARVTVGISGTGGGFKKFTAGETDINDASRTVESSEIEMAKASEMEFIELAVAFDGISVVVNPNNTFVDFLTTEELKKIWQPGSTVNTWNDVRSSWPDSPLTLYGPGTDSGTFDYFTEAINGQSGACRPDFTASEDDNVLVQGIIGDENALGFFGYAYYIENSSRLKVVPIEGGNGAVVPSDTSINNGTYQPLSRPLFIYVRQKAAERPEVEAFVNFYLEQAPILAQEVGYVPLPQNVYDLTLARFQEGVTGSLFANRSTVGVDLHELLE